MHIVVKSLYFDTNPKTTWDVAKGEIHMLDLAKIKNVFTVIGVAALLHSLSAAQATDPLIGSWNFKVTVSGECIQNCKYMGMLAFNQGGTVIEQRATAVEYEGLGYVERTSLGSWRSSNGMPPYTFKVKNFIFDSNGRLSASIVGISGVTLSSNRNSFTGSGTAKILSVGDTHIETVSFVITGTRF